MSSNENYILNFREKNWYSGILRKKNSKKNKKGKKNQIALESRHATFFPSKEKYLFFTENCFNLNFKIKNSFLSIQYEKKSGRS